MVRRNKIFKGQLNHMTICSKCRDVCEAPCFFWMLPLSIKDPRQAFKVDKGLEDFFSKDKVDGENKMYCAECNEKRDAFIMCEMTQPPNVLTLMLKRFHYDYKLKSYVKLHCEAEVPLVLQIQDCTYDLYAMIKHYGTHLSGGHYVAYIHSVQTKQWYIFDDERVKLKQNYSGSGKTYLRSSSVYLLMYRKRRKVYEDEEEDDGAKEAHRNDKTHHENYKTPENMSETGRDAIKTPSPKWHGLNGPLNSDSVTPPYQESVSNKQVLHKNKVDTADRFKTVYSTDYIRHTSATKSRRARHAAGLADNSVKSTKRQVWK